VDGIAMIAAIREIVGSWQVGRSEVFVKMSAGLFRNCLDEAKHGRSVCAKATLEEPEFYAEAEYAFSIFRATRQKLTGWPVEIATMWRFTKNNGITEGFHAKMEVLQRQAYGFRNFDIYQLRVKIRCS
jgi:hypothetical protein